MNEDGTIGTADVIQVSRYIQGLTTEFEVRLSNADVTLDGEITEADVQKLHECIAGTNTCETAQDEYEDVVNNDVEFSQPIGLGESFLLESKNTDEEATFTFEKFSPDQQVITFREEESGEKEFVYDDSGMAEFIYFGESFQTKLNESSATVKIENAEKLTNVVGHEIQVTAGDSTYTVSPNGQGESVQTGGKLTDVKSSLTIGSSQTLKFDYEGGSSPIQVISEENDLPSEEHGLWLFVPEGDNPETDAFFEWSLSFSEPWNSNIVNNSGQLSLEGLEGNSVNILGTQYEVKRALLSDSDAALTVEFAEEGIQDTLTEGQTETYQLDGLEQETTLVFVSNPDAGEPEVKVSVEGEITDALAEGDTDVLSTGLIIGVKEIDIQTNQATLFITENFLELQDLELEDNEFWSRGVEMNFEAIEDGFVQFSGEVVDDGNSFVLNSIRYRLTADAITGTTNIYVPPGHSVREFLDEPEGLLSPSFDIKYVGPITEEVVRGEWYTGEPIE